MVPKLSQNESEGARLERLWASEFGDEYVERNRDIWEHRGAFWQEMLEAFPARKVLEVGCSLGANLRWIAGLIEPRNVYGVDINIKSLQELHNLLPEVNALRAPARELPFRDRWFDLVFTMGVLIHQPEDTLPLVMSEVVRCSNRYVLCTEYYSDESIDVAYRGQRGALFKRDYAGIYQKLFPELRLIREGFLSRKDGWDDVSYWVFERT